MSKLKIRYQLIRGKVANGNYKDPKSMPVTKDVGIDIETGKPKKLQDFEIICHDFPLAIPLILYNQERPHDIVCGAPIIEYKGDLYGIYNFTQLEKVNDEIVVNIWVMYAGDPTKSTLTVRQ